MLLKCELQLFCGKNLLYMEVSPRKCLIFLHFSPKSLSHRLVITRPMGRIGFHTPYKKQLSARLWQIAIWMMLCVFQSKDY